MVSFRFDILRKRQLAFVLGQQFAIIIVPLFVVLGPSRLRPAEPKSLDCAVLCFSTQPPQLRLVGERCAEVVELADTPS